MIEDISLSWPGRGRGIANGHALSHQDLGFLPASYLTI